MEIKWFLGDIYKRQHRKKYIVYGSSKKTNLNTLNTLYLLWNFFYFPKWHDATLNNIGSHLQNEPFVRFRCLKVVFF